MRSPLLLFFTLFYSTINAQWNNSTSINNAICNFAGNQTLVQVISDGAGGAISTWVDTRNGSQDIYAQRIDANGTLLWNVDGIAICNAASDQFTPKLASDGSGGAIIAWYDNRNGNWDIYAQRINAAGVVQWAVDGIAICTVAGNQNAQQIIADGSGGAIITWSDGRSGGPNADIFAQRVTASGSVLWTTDGTSVCNASSLQNIPQLVSDGSGGAIIAWEDWRNFSQPDIYVQRISFNGFASWTFNGVVICSEPNFANQYNTKIVSDGSGGAILCWLDNRNFGSNTDIYSQRVNSSGIPQWTNNGVAICTANAIQLAQQMMSDGAGGAIIAWEDRRVNRDIYTQRINISGAVQWAANGIAVCNTADIQEEPQLVARTGGAIFLWTDSRNSAQQDIYAQAMDNTGSPLWIANGVPVSNEAHAQSAAQLITDGADGAIIAWQDLRTTLDYDIYSSRLFAGGTLPLKLLSFDATANKNDVTLVWTTENEINSSHFDVEVSADGIAFKKLSTIKATNLTGKNSYSYIHTNVTDNVLFYRLKEVDADNRFTYSATAKVNINSNIRISVYPNPASATLQIKNINPAAADFIQVFSSAGELLIEQKATANMQLDIKKLTAGFYIIRILKKDGTAQPLYFTKQ